MARTTRRIAPMALCALLAASVAALPTEARAQEDAEQEEIDLEALQEQRDLVASRHRLRRRVSRYIEAAMEAVDEENPEEAIRLLERIRKGRLNPLEEAYVLRMLGFVEYGAGKTEEAIEHFEQAIAQEAMKLREESRLRFNVAQLHASMEEWQEVVRSIDEWLRYEPDPQPLGFYLRAIANYQLENVDAAIADTRKAIEVAPEPREQWLRLLAALYSQKQEYANATPILEELVLRFPKKQYWVQLSLIYAARDDYETSLAVQQVAHQQGFLTEDKELQRLARSYLYHDLPYPAAKVLENGLEDGTIEPDAEVYELLANSWIAAREYDRSLPPLRKAAELSEDGNLYVRLGQVYMQRERWEEATKMFEKALRKGGLKNRGNAELLSGIAYYNSERPETARNYFVRARSYEETRAEAERWITHLANEASGKG